MSSRCFTMVLTILGLLAPGAWLGRAAPGPPAEDARSVMAQGDFFEKSIRPLLVENCFACHGSQKQKGGLRLDSRESMMTGGDSGAIIIPGKPGKSLFITAVNYADKPQMPPKGKLKPAQITALTTWISHGAYWPETAAGLGRAAPATPAGSATEFVISQREREFWSFRPINNPLLPEVQDSVWPRTPLDYFVLNRLEANGLRPAGACDKRALLRRATFDLIGLPPRASEIEDFLHDDSPNAFARVVDRLLASPRYGERWARHWLDVARYGEDQAHTFQSRKYPNGFRYRDWLIRAFNADMPYDQFIREQIAGDLLDGPGKLERLAALGFFALGPVYYGDPKKLDQLDDRIDTLSRGFLGLTVACARCHDHKFDPISSKDYYSLAGIFASTEYWEVPLVPPEVVEAAKRKLTAEQKKEKVAPKYPLIHSLQDGAKPVKMRVHLRGNPDTLGEEVPHRFLAILDAKGNPFGKGSGRLELANAIACKDNPLTARVLVNRIWQHHFGRGLVKTASNFGALGERPTNAELLDHLATRLIQCGWSIKAIHREIMLSATYQQSCRFDEQSYDLDPDNKLLWRMNRRRLEVEAWRDAMLAVAGHLEATIGGPSRDLAGPDNCRRTVYAQVSRHELNGLLRLFDFPDPNITNEERTVTTVPSQQLFVLNDELMVRSAKAVAARLAAGSDKDNAARIRRAFTLLYGRPATDPEVQLGLDFLGSAGLGPVETSLTPWEQYAQVLLSASEFLYLD